MVPQAMPWGCPGSPGTEHPGFPGWVKPSQAPKGMKERLCYLFPSKNQLLLNSCLSSQVSPLPLRGLGLIHSLLLFGILSREAAWLVPSSGSHGTKFMNLLLIAAELGTKCPAEIP